MDPLPAEIDAAVHRRLREQHVHGAAVCGFDRDGLVFAGGVGHADLRRGEEVGPSTVFRVASISKLLTTTLVLTLVDSGDLDLDRPVVDDLPADLRIVDGDGRPAESTLRSLLSHSSGLPYGVRGADVGNAVMSWVANQGQVRTLADAVRGLEVVRPPGERVVYSNPAFNVAGHLAALATGRSFEEAAEARVLGPLGMSDSTFRHRRRGPGVATPHGTVAPPRVSRKPVERMDLVATPMGGLTTTVEDLARFGRMVLRGGEVEAGASPLLSADLVDAATTVEAANHPGLEQGYGLGFKVRRWRGRTLVGHDGFMPGVATKMLLSPSDGVGAVALTNGFALSVPHETVVQCLEHLLGLPPAPSPTADLGGLPVGDWEEAGRRAEGSYRLCDASPAGIVGRLIDAMTRIRVHHDVGGRLRVDGDPGAGGPQWLHPDGRVGHYRVTAAVDDGTNAVLDDTGGTLDLWSGYAGHLRRR